MGEVGEVVGMMKKGMRRSAVSFADPLPHSATPTTLRKSLRARVASSVAKVLLMWRRLVELAATERKPAVLPSQSVSRQELQQQLQEQRERADKLAQEMEGMKVGARAREPRAISTKSMEGLKEFTGDSSAKIWINRARDLLELAKMSPADEVLALKTKLSQPVYTVMDLRLKERVQ